jgi:ribosomal protein S19
MTIDPVRVWMRRGRILLVVVGLLLGAAAGAAWVLFQLYGPDRIRTELERALSTASGRPARVVSPMKKASKKTRTRRLVIRAHQRRMSCPRTGGSAVPAISRPVKTCKWRTPRACDRVV